MPSTDGSRKFPPDAAIRARISFNARAANSAKRRALRLCDGITWAQSSPSQASATSESNSTLARELSAGEGALDHDEVIRVSRVPFEETFAMIRRGDIIDAKTIAALYPRPRLHRPRAQPLEASPMPIEVLGVEHIDLTVNDVARASSLL